MKSLKKILAAAAVCVMALAVFTACAMSESEHTDALIAALKELASEAGESGVTIVHDTSLDARAKSILDDLKTPEIPASTPAVIVKRQTTDKDDKAAIKKEAQAIVDAIEAKYDDGDEAEEEEESDDDNSEEEANNAYSVKIGFAYGKVKGEQYIVAAFED